METNKVPLVDLQDTYSLRMKPFLVFLRFKELFTSAFFINILLYTCVCIQCNLALIRMSLTLRKGRINLNPPSYFKKN